MEHGIPPCRPRASLPAYQRPKWLRGLRSSARFGLLLLALGDAGNWSTDNGSRRAQEWRRHASCAQLPGLGEPRAHRLPVPRVRPAPILGRREGAGTDHALPSMSMGRFGPQLPSCSIIGLFASQDLRWLCHSFPSLVLLLCGLTVCRGGRRYALTLMCLPRRRAAQGLKCGLWCCCAALGDIFIDRS
jgi:hypothetical protein